MNNNLKITADEGYWFGLGAFETIWVYKNKAVFIEEHLDRLKNAVFYLNIVQEPIDQWIDKRKKEIEKYLFFYTFCLKNSINIWKSYIVWKKILQNWNKSDMILHIIRKNENKDKINKGCLKES